LVELELDALAQFMAFAGRRDALATEWLYSAFRACFPAQIWIFEANVDIAEHC